MKRQRIYIDTSVIGGYYDVEFDTATRQLFKRIADKEFDIYFSEVNDTELINAPQHVKEVKNLIPVDCFHYIEMTDETKALALSYIEGKGIRKSKPKRRISYRISFNKQTRLPHKLEF